METKQTKTGADNEKSATGLRCRGTHVLRGRQWWCLPERDRSYSGREQATERQVLE